MALYPDIQAKAQREIDTVIGTECLPTAEDRKNLPYTECLAYEVLRWQPSTPIGWFFQSSTWIILSSPVQVFPMFVCRTMNTEDIVSRKEL